MLTNNHTRITMASNRKRMHAAKVTFRSGESGPLPAWKLVQTVLQSSLDGTHCDEDEQHDRIKWFEIDSEQEWHDCFPLAFVDVAKQSLRAPQDATKIAEQGLQAIHNLIHFHPDNSGEAVLLDRVIENSVNSSKVLKTFETRGKLDFEDLSQWVHSHFTKMKTYVKMGHAEPSALSAIEMVDVNPAWCDLRDRNFVVFGALSRFAPIIELLRSGANVLAVDAPSNYAWDELVSRAAKQTSGVLKIPYLDSIVGADVCESLSEIALWIVDETKNNPATILTILDPTTGDGEDLLRISACTDAIIEYVCNQVPETALATFNSPVDVHCVPSLCANTSNKRYQNRPVFLQLLQRASRGKWFQQNTSQMVVERQVGEGKVPLGNAIKSQAHLGRHDSNSRMYMVQDNISILERDACALQLALLIQRYRIIVARAIGTYRWLADKRKHRVSANTLPLYIRDEDEGFVRFGVGKFTAAEVREVGFLLLVRDMKDPQSPGNPTLQIDNSLEVFRDAAVHGGLFRCAFKLSSFRVAAKAMHIGERLIMLAIVVAIVVVVLMLLRRGR